MSKVNKDPAQVDAMGVEERQCVESANTTNDQISCCEADPVMPMTHAHSHEINLSLPFCNRPCDVKADLFLKHKMRLHTDTVQE